MTDEQLKLKIDGYLSSLKFLEVCRLLGDRKQTGNISLDLYFTMQFCLTVLELIKAGSDPRKDSNKNLVFKDVDTKTGIVNLFSNTIKDLDLADCEKLCDLLIKNCYTFDFKAVEKSAKALIEFQERLNERSSVDTKINNVLEVTCKHPELGTFNFSTDSDTCVDLSKFDD